MIPSHKRPEAPERPITFRAAEELGAFQLAELWADRTAWPIDRRTAYDELAELATMSALAKWLTRWQSIAIHSAVLAGARMEATRRGARQQPSSGVRPLARLGDAAAQPYRRRQARDHGREV